MRLNLIDTRPLAVAVVQPASGLIHNWSTGQLEQLGAQPAGQHLRPLVSIPGATGAWVSIVSADLGGALDSAGAFPVVAVVDGSGNPTAFVDWNTLAMTGPNPQTWNWPR